MDRWSRVRRVAHVRLHSSSLCGGLRRRARRCRDQGRDRVYVALRRRRIGRRDLGRDSLCVATSVLRQVSLPSSDRARVGRRRRGGESSQQRQGARRAEETGR
ncbi:hypothetical protein Taro_054547 [Colocasia esculenta]|uniref:Uncharacterized protein n=1 Tax=Colocasia esculenta TaxID=4460 RepID=A0A843XQC7_COLES|nr:hypothetical protein [Colocasia esculenta]